ncbi:zinc finger protein 2 isoform X3 [Bactrocera neohumeralis]|uniref:zinc finger protein 2 isoform X3 n=1 Tax=Bactrocera neohumeralis TaxID=98809 RepID=UPI0021665E1F|nr:zinc finger protein 2 isoform X3 [Bactrocera neohumeralis]
MSDLPLKPIERKSITTREISPTTVTNAGIATVTATETTAAKSKPKLSKFATLKSHNKAQYLIPLQHKETAYKATSQSLQQSAIDIFAADIKKPTSPQHLEHLTRSKAVFERKRRRRCKNKRSCSLVNVKVADLDENLETDDQEPMLRADVELFQGKIVFNLDGNAFIIATESSTQDSILNAKTVQKTTESKQLLASNVVGETNIATINLTTTTVASATTTTLNTSSTTLEEAPGGQDGQRPDALKCSASPRIHSFRIVSAQDATTANVANTTATDKSSVEKTEFRKLYIEQQQRSRYSTFDDNDSDSSNGHKISSKIQKPILMCFICKLSFGNTKSFSLHANTEHQLTLQAKEQHLLNREYSSVIIQPQNMDERPQISFLEPIDVLNVIQNDNLNSETDIQFNEGTSQVFSCRIDSTVDTSNSEKSTAGCVIREKSEKPAPISSHSNSLSPSSPSTYPESSVVPKTQTALSPSKTVPNTLSSAIECINDSHLLLTTSFSKCMLQEQQYEVNVPVPTIAVTTLLSGPKFDSSEQQQQQKIKASAPIESVDSTVQSASISPPLFPSTENMLGASTLLLPKKESENITKLDETHSFDTRITSGSVLCSNADVQLKPRLIASPIPTTKNTSMTCDMGNNDKRGLYSDILSPPLSTFRESHDKMLQMSTLAANAPITQGDCEHFQEPSGTVSEEDNMLNSTDTLAATVTFLQQQQRKIATMSSSSFDPPQPGLVTIAPTPTQLSCLQASLAALSDDLNFNCGTTDAHKTNAKLFTDFLQQHLTLQQQKAFSDISGNYSEHADHNDGENCEIQQLKTPPYHISNHQFTNNTSQFSPNRNNGSCTNSAIMKSPAHMATSPTAVNVSTAAVTVTATTQQQHAAAAVAVAAAAAAAAAVSVANNTPSFTIGACSDHINGRPLGVECARCEMILNSTRLNTGVQMSTRNSCKTLKCPQCNWHYKYQETLEIHMREKHPDGESACGYCLSGQQHPRLARGESYSCGYKPYRCEICNYSTTTKGNLSIHMQSDKHLNNMQELNSSQSMLAAAVAAANCGKADVASKMLMSNNAAAAAQQQQQQQALPQSQPQQPHSTLVASSSMISSGGPSINAGGRASVDGIGTNCSMLNKNKPSFRCDICSYETSVARNLRIHMTSEKHTHNLAALQNNIKHIQAYSFLQQHQQVMAAHQQQQLAAATQVPQSQLPALANSFLPEIALADLAYNQAIMIQLLQHNSVSQQQQQHESVAKMQIKTSPCSSPRSMQIEQQSTVHQQQQQLQQLRQHLQQSYSPNNSSSLLPSADPFSTSDVHFSSNVSGSCSNDESLELPIYADPCPKSVYSCLVCGVYGTNILDELNQHLLIDRSRSCKKQQSTPTNTVKSSCTEKANVTNSNEVMVILNNNYICRLCNYKTNLKANFQLHSKTDKHLQKLNYINHVHEGGTQNEYKLKHLHLASNTVQLKCNCCDFYTNSIQKLSLHTQHMRHDTMRIIFQHLLHIMEQQNFERNKTEQMPPHSKTHSLKDAVEIVPNIRESHSVMPVHENDGSPTNRSSSIVVEDTPQSMQKSLTCQLCGFSTFTLLNMIQHVKSMRHMQIEQFVNLQRRSEQLDPPSLDDIFKVVERPTLQSLALTVAARQEENNRIENVSTTSVSPFGNFPVPMARLPNDDFGCITSSRDHNSFSPSSSSSTASGNTSVRNKSYNSVNIFNFQTINDDKDASSSVLPGGSLSVMPSVVFKCNNCDFFAHSKTEMELHLSAVHPQTEPDYISIPTNSAAIEAFQAAIAAATAAASAVTATCAPSNKSYSENDNFSTIVKRERLCTPKDEENVKSTDVQNTMSLQDVSTVTPWLTSTPNIISNNETSAAIVQPKSIHNVLRELEKTAEQEEQLIEDTSGVNALVESTKTISGESVNVQCPLCTDTFDSKQTLEMHLMNVHSVNRDGLSRLLQLVDTSAWDLNGKTSVTLTVAKECKGSNIATETTTEQTITGNFNIKASTELDLSLMEVSNDTPLNLNVSHTSTYMHSMESLNNNKLSCEQCGSKFKHELQLLQHAQKMQHFIMLPNGDHRCLAASHLSRPCQSTFPTQAAMVIHYKNTHTSLVISERHVYKYRCKHCSLAFKTQEKLSTHLLYHTMREATKCMFCQRNFRTTQALQKHIDQTHHSSGDQHVASNSPSTALSCSGRGSPALQMSHVQNKTQLNEVISDNAAKNQDINDLAVRESPPMTPKANESPNAAPSPLPANILQDQQQQQHVAAFTAALLNQPLQQQQHISGDELTESGGHLTQHLQMKPRSSLLTQKYLHQQNLQNIQQLPQLTAAASTSGLQLNPVEMFNLMQFHHIMSMNFMNLAPPLIFGVGTNSGSGGNVDLLTSTHTPKVTHNTSANALQCGNDMSVPRTSVSPRADLIGTLQQHPQSQSQQSAPTNTVQMGSNQKRARTRITDDQLKILRAHFDINNSPSEESIMEMSQKANLPMKVVKHWFRNTLFKERQRNKDSPYNFNNPPSTTLNLEEYERTGHAKVMPLNEDLSMSSHNSKHQQQKQNMHTSNSKNNSKEKPTPMSDICGDSSLLIEIKTEPFDDNIEPHITTPGSPQRQNEQQQSQEQSQREQHKKDEKDLLSTSSTLLLSKRQQYLSALPATEHQQQLLETPENTAVETAAVTPLQQHNHQQQHLSGQSNQNIHQQQSQHINLYSYETKSESGSSDILSRPQSPNNSSTVVATHYASINELINQQLDNLPLGQNSSNINAANMHGNNMGPPKNFQSSKSFDKNSPSSQFDTNSNSSNASSTSSGKRANRTRFTDYQIKVLQEFFENNSYPKDSDLEYLSKLLLLSPRVIVVWFQNARQKQRKIYENQPNNSLYETEEKKHNINYACKKCNMTFQRYYELIRHQKNHCFKEENNKKSAKAQIAAAQIAQNLSSEDSNSSMDINNSSAYQLHHQHISNAGATAVLSSTANVSSTSPSSAAPDLTSPQHLFSKSSMSMTDFSPSTTPTPPQTQRERSDSSELLPQGPVHKSKFECDKCKLQFSYYEHFREHQLLHLVNPSLFTTQITNLPDAYGSFGSILQSLQQVATASATHQQHHQFLEQQDQPPAKKRKCSETSSTTDEVPGICGSGDGEISSSASFSKSKRYDFLYQYFMQNESNNELKQQFQAQHKKSNEPEIEIEYLANFYHQSELRKRSNYDFLYQYYQKNEHIKQMSALPSQAGFFGSENKPNIDVLLQYYQLNESKKFFQLNASNQEINDHTAASPISTSHVQRVNNPIPISTSDHTTTPRVDRYDITDMSLFKNSLDVLNSTINFPDYDNDNNDHEKSSNGCGMDVDDAEIYTDTDDHINDNNQKSNEIYGHKSQINVVKRSNDTDNKDYKQVANKLAKIDQINKLATNLQSPSSYGNDQHKLKNLSKSLVRCVKNQKDNLAKRKASNESSKTKATTTTNFNNDHIDNLKDFLHVNQKSESTEKSKQQKYYNDLLQAQNETNGLGNNELALQTMDKRQLPETPISSPNSTTNSNNKPTVGSSNTTADTVTGITEKQQSKRLRTTILPEQLNFLYECYQNESNPSRKMLEEIAKKVNLKKRVVQVWFQNSRAKDKKSRNQRFTAISDDSNYEDASQNNRDYGLFQKNALKSIRRHGSKDANFLPDSNISNNTNTGMELGGCNLSQLSQVNIQQHALSIEHICKVKKLLEKTAVEVKLNIDSKIFSTAGTDDNVEYGNKQNATDKPNTNSDLKERKYVTSDEADFNSTHDSNLKAHMDNDIAGSDRLGTFTRIYKELKLQNAKKRAIDYTSNNQNSELMEWYERGNINNESKGLTTKDMSYNRCKGLQPQITKQTSEENNKRPESYKIINLTFSAENIDNTDNKSSNGNKNCGQHVEAQDYKHYNDLNNIVNNKVTSITDDEDTYIGEYKDSSDGNALDLNDNNETKQNPSTRNERITANSSSTSCTLTTSTTHTQLTNAHEKYIIQQIFNCNQITDNFSSDGFE